MAKETAWVHSSEDPPPPKEWEFVHLTSSTRCDHSEMRWWCLRPEQAGEFGYATSFSGMTKHEFGTVWAFSNPKTAFDFKMRFG